MTAILLTLFAATLAAEAWTSVTLIRFRRRLRDAEARAKNLRTQLSEERTAHALRIGTALETCDAATAAIAAARALRIQTNGDGTLDEIAGPAHLEHMGGDVWNLVFSGPGSLRAHFNILRMDAWEGATLPRIHREPCLDCERWKWQVQSRHRRAQAAEGERDRLRAWALRLREIARAGRHRALSPRAAHALATMPLCPPTVPSGPPRLCGCGDLFWPSREWQDDCERCEWGWGLAAGQEGEGAEWEPETPEEFQARAARIWERRGAAEEVGVHGRAPSIDTPIPYTLAGPATCRRCAPRTCACSAEERPAGRKED